MGFGSARQEAINTEQGLCRETALADTLSPSPWDNFSPSDRNTPDSWSAGEGFGFEVGCVDQAFGKAIKGGDSWAGRLGPRVPLGPCIR